MLQNTYLRAIIYIPMDTYGNFNTVFLNTLLLLVLFISDTLELQQRIRI